MYIICVYLLYYSLIWLILTKPPHTEIKLGLKHVYIDYILYNISEITVLLEDFLLFSETEKCWSESRSLQSEHHKTKFVQSQLVILLLIPHISPTDILIYTKTRSHLFVWCGSLKLCDLTAPRTKQTRIQSPAASNEHCTRPYRGSHEHYWFIISCLFS